MSATNHGLTNDQINDFKRKLLMQLVVEDDPLTLVEVAAALDETARQKVEEYVEGLEGGEADG